MSGPDPGSSSQQTIRSPVALSGIGLHTGAPARIVCSPAPPDSGITFIRADHAGAEPIPARLANVIDTRRGVTIGAGWYAVRTVEHLLAAASGLGISNLRVEVYGEELPALDGSAAPYCAALSQAGVEVQDWRWTAIAPVEPVWIVRGAGWMLAVPSARLRITYVVPTGHPMLGTQVADFDATRQRFTETVAPARTWGFTEEMESLNAAGLARGATTENALGIGPQGYVNPPRFVNEPARHKVLDLIGDLTLLGRPLAAHVIALGAGHTLHIELARALAGAP